MNIEPLRIGIIGCGTISSAYLKGADASPWLSVSAVADINPTAAQSQAAIFGVAAVDSEALLADPDIDLVVNLTIPAVHAAVSTQIVEAGKHVYSEKPLALSVDEAAALLSLAKARGVRVGCAPDTFLGAAHQAARNAVDAGGIGELLGGALAFLSRGMEAWHPNPDFFFKAGGGPILDLGPYYITQLVNLAGPVASVSATSGRGYASRTIGSGQRQGDVIPVELPTSVSALLTLESGARITLDASWDVWKHVRSPIELYGTQGSLLVPDPNFFGGSVQRSERDGDWQDVSSSDFAFGKGNRTLRSGKVVADYRAAGVGEMAAAIRQNRPHRASGELALHVLDVLDCIMQAAGQHREVKIESTCERPLPLPTGPDETVFASSNLLAGQH